MAIERGRPECENRTAGEPTCIERDDGDGYCGPCVERLIGVLRLIEQSPSIPLDERVHPTSMWAQRARALTRVIAEIERIKPSATVAVVPAIPTDEDDEAMVEDLMAPQRAGATPEGGADR